MMKNFRPKYSDIQNARKFIRENVIPALEEQADISRGLGRKVILEKSDDGFDASLSIENQSGDIELDIKFAASLSEKSIYLLCVARTRKNNYEFKCRMNDYNSPDHIRDLIIGYMGDSLDSITS